MYTYTVGHKFTVNSNSIHTEKEIKMSQTHEVDFYTQ